MEALVQAQAHGDRARDGDLTDEAWGRIITELKRRRQVLHIPIEKRRDPWLEQKRR